MKAFIKSLRISLVLIALSTLLNDCKLFEQPIGMAELIDIYTYEDRYEADTNTGYTVMTDSVRYIGATLKISNICDTGIYSSTISIKAMSSKKITYYKTVSLDITISPGSSIYIPVEMEINVKQKGETFNTKEENREIWKKDTIEIINEYYK
ncbi:MAG: hypothetical protein K6E97_11445 [Treponema sp.]|nr:hypothetical protein [Treponema sp.]